MRDLATLYTTVVSYVWDEEDMDYVVMTQPTGGGGGGGVSSEVVVTNSLVISTLPALPTGANTIGKVDINGTVPVSGDFYQETQPVSIAAAVGVTGTFWQATQPVSIASMPTTPVTGTFWQATQPISGAVSISGTPSVSVAGSVAVTGTFWQATQPVSVASLPSLAAGANAIGSVSVSNFPATQPVSGTFWQATQPVSLTSTTITGTVASTQSGTWNIGSITTLPALPTGANTIGAVNVNGTVPVSGTFYQVTQPVSGAFWQATQPVSLASMPALAAGTNNIGDVDVLSLPALPAGDNNIGNVDVTSITLPTLTKGTQGATGISTQDLKDAGRVALTFYAVAAASGATTVETAITLTKSAGTAATSTATSFVVTSGKRFRISSIVFASRGHATATAQITTFSLRVNTGGAVTTSSTPIILRASTANPATALAWDRYTAVLPDGYEIVGDGTLQFGITANATFTTNAPTWFVTIHGFEY